MLIFLSNRTGKTDRQFAFEERVDAKMFHLSPRCILSMPLRALHHGSYFPSMLPATLCSSSPTAPCQAATALGFTSRSLLVLSVTVVVRVHVLQKMAAAARMNQPEKRTHAGSSMGRRCCGRDRRVHHQVVNFGEASTACCST
jgi:hypothetical protein